MGPPGAGWGARIVPWQASVAAVSGPAVRESLSGDVIRGTAPITRDK